MATSILALSGSLRAASYNTALLRTAAELVPDGATVTLYDYRDVPLYDADLDKPGSVEAFEAALRGADGLLIATPEYNYSVPGVLKNALDWASRPAYKGAIFGLPTGIVSASGSFVGGARAQQHLKPILLAMGVPVFPWPELLVGGAGGKIADGHVTDEPTRGFLRSYLEGFVPWVVKQGR
ncbi:MAG: NAD(P)H-dependent oxidoreductase [Alphaproteobacteria bacterium]|nr:NAD(P)H-dependent oxidoreductase [Alphaproteobacteria bacterium]